jgi:hypothetical protein
MTETTKRRDMLHPAQAYRAYDLTPQPASDNISDLEESLRETGIASVEIPVKPHDFASLSEAYEECIQECPEALAATASRLDERYGSEIGQARKECGIVSGVQVSDPKNLFHFSEIMRTDEWRRDLGDIPASLQRFLDMGMEIHAILLQQVAQKAIGALAEGSYTNLSRLYLPEGKDDKIETDSILRVIRYDDYEPYDQRTGAPLKLGAVAKRHYDIGGITVQAYADAGGFWGNPGGNMAPHEEREYHPTTDGSGYVFFGQAHRRIFGSGDPIQPLWHGVDRVIPADRPQALEDGLLVVSSDGTTRVPKRTAVILFGNAPHVDPGVTARDTKPNIEQVA